LLRLDRVRPGSNAVNDSEEEEAREEEEESLFKADAVNEEDWRTPSATALPRRRKWTTELRPEAPLA